jgi:ABC-type transporter Mla MlaB component
MLRIQRSMQDGVVRLTLSGRIDGEHLPDLRRLIEGEAPRRGLILDLEEVSLVDQDAVRLLARCEAAGATLERCAAYVREWITREGRRSERPRRRTSRSRNRRTTPKKRGEP